MVGVGGGRGFRISGTSDGSAEPALIAAVKLERLMRWEGGKEGREEGSERVVTG